MITPNVPARPEWESAFPKEMPTYEKRARLFLRRARSTLYALSAQFRFALPRQQRPHALKSELILSLTSYPPRYPTLHRTLWCLLSQTVKPDRVILWIAQADAATLPSAVKGLEEQGLEIRFCEDTGPYKKIIPALTAFPEAYIVTADDDLYYATDWLDTMLSAWNGQSHQIVCHRAHSCKLEGKSKPASYHEWAEAKPGETGPGIFPVGCGGVFYPPHSLSPDITNEHLFMCLSPRADDIWLFWMARLAGSCFQKTPANYKLISWDETEKYGLRYENCEESANDKKIKAMIDHFGWPDIRP